MATGADFLPPERKSYYNWDLRHSAAQGLGRASQAVLGIGPEDFGPRATGGALVRPGVPPAVAGLGVRPSVPQPVAAVAEPTAVVPAPREGAEPSLYDKIVRAVQGEAGKWSLGGPDPVSSALEKAFPIAPRGARLDEVSREAIPADGIGPTSEAPPKAPTTFTSENAPAAARPAPAAPAAPGGPGGRPLSEMILGALAEAETRRPSPAGFAGPALRTPAIIPPGPNEPDVDPRWFKGTPAAAAHLQQFIDRGQRPGQPTTFTQATAAPPGSALGDKLRAYYSDPRLAKILPGLGGDAPALPARDLQGPNPMGAGLTALLQDWKPTSPEHQRMATSLLGGDPEALRGFQAALAEGGPDATALGVRLGGRSPGAQVRPATTSIRELRGNQENQSTATTVPTGGPGGGNWINPGYPGWDEKNILPVGGGQFRDFNFGGYGNPYMQQFAQQAAQHALLSSMGPTAGVHYLAAQMAAQTKGRELDIEAQKAKSEAEYRQVHGAALTKQAETQAHPPKLSPEEIQRERFDFAVKQDPSLIAKHPSIKQQFLPGTLTPKEQLQAKLGLPAGEDMPTLQQALAHHMTLQDLMDSPLRAEFLQEKANRMAPRHWGDTALEWINPNLRESHARAAQKASASQGKSDEELWAEMQKEARQ